MAPLLKALGVNIFVSSSALASSCLPRHIVEPVSIRAGYARPLSPGLSWFVLLLSLLSLLWHGFHESTAPNREERAEALKSRVFIGSVMVTNVEVYLSPKHVHVSHSQWKYCHSLCDTCTCLGLYYNTPLLDWDTRRRGETVKGTTTPWG